MSEEKNIEHNPENIHDTEPENIQSATSSKELETSNNKLETDNMEVHHHPDLYHKPKPWKEYILEGLMIFIAVTLGFFAESLRENLSDKSKEKEYIHSLKQDLVSDTANISSWVKVFYARIEEFDSLINFLHHPETVSNGADMYYFTRLSTRGTVFGDNNNTISQLKSSGNFHLISNKVVAEKIVSYENDIENYKSVQDIDQKEAQQLYPYIGNLFDAFVLNDMTRSTPDTSRNSYTDLAYGYRSIIGKPSGNPQLKNQNNEMINELVYHLHQRKSTFGVEISLLYLQNKNACKLIDVINTEYHLANE